jgi:hypothetical protein
VNTWIDQAKYWVKTAIWILTGYFDRQITINTPQKVTVLITYFNPVRMKNINHQIRNILKCDFVERLIISNHNPEVHIQDRITVKNARITVQNQTVKRGCGFRWQVASEFAFEHLIVIDDDFLLSSSQLADLFQVLIAQPDIPHGLSGMNLVPSGGYEFLDRQSREVDFLCEIYAVTRGQLNRYLDITSIITNDEKIAKSVDSTADFLVISRMGTSKPKIHDLGRIFRDQSFKMEGVAVHKDQTFDQNVEHVLNAIQNLGLI